MAKKIQCSQSGKILPNLVTLVQVLQWNIAIAPEKLKMVLICTAVYCMKLLRATSSDQSDKCSKVLNNISRVVLTRTFPILQILSSNLLTLRINKNLSIESPPITTNACHTRYVPYPGGGEKWGGNGVGDDLYSFGFDGAYLWTGGRSTLVIPSINVPYVKKGDNIGVALDLTVPIITFFYNGMKIPGYFRNFNLNGMFFPVISSSAKIR